MTQPRSPAYNSECRLLKAICSTTSSSIATTVRAVRQCQCIVLICPTYRRGTAPTARGLALALFILCYPQISQTSPKLVVERRGITKD
jgi:hypothetical protein